MDRLKVRANNEAGGAQKKKQKMEIDAQPGSSSSSLSLSNVQVEMNNQVEVEGDSLIDKLLPEILMKILEFLDGKSLALSRLVSRKWNGMAREILQSKEDVETVFNCETTEDGNIKIDGKTERSSLENFTKWFEDSNESPLYTRFLFYDIKASVFGHAAWIKFISTCGSSIKCLKLVVEENESADNMTQIAEKLRNLLLRQLPNLQEFGLEPSCQCNNNAQEIQLFPTTTVQLPNLKVLYLDDRTFATCTRIVIDLLRASENLQKLEPFGRTKSFTSIPTFQLLQYLGKLDCLQTAVINLDAEFMTKIKEKSKAPLVFKLKKLNLYVLSVLYDKSTWLDASLFLSNLFEGSKDSLRELTTEALSFLPQLHLPKFSRLTNLTVEVMLWNERIISRAVFPSGLNLMEVFPVLKYLELRVPWTVFFSNVEHANGPCLPNLKSLKISGRELLEEDIKNISEACPNLKEFEINHDHFGEPIENFHKVGEAIWIHLKQLESLDLAICTSSPANAFPAIDSTITGFSREDCKYLYDLIEVRKILDKDKVSEAELKVERRNPSILDLKDLKNLRILLVSRAREDSEEYKSEDEEDEEDEEPEEYDSEYESEPESEETAETEMKEITFISEEFAFNLMKSLSYEIDTEDQY